MIIIFIKLINLSHFNKFFHIKKPKKISKNLNIKKINIYLIKGAVRVVLEGPLLLK